MPFEILAPPGWVETNGLETVPLLTVDIPEGAAVRIVADVIAYNGAVEAYWALFECLAYRNGAADVVIVGQSLNPKWATAIAVVLQVSAAAVGPSIVVNVTGVAAQIFRWVPVGEAYCLK
jgi:hypothetical protein